MGRSNVSAVPLGREVELATLRTAPLGHARVLTGPPGIGKTTLWEAGIEAARGNGLPVLSAAPGDGETQLSFAALIDLFDGVPDATLAELPTPQRRALEVALLRREPAGPPPEPHAIGLAVLNSLRALAPVLVAVDDVQWLDPASAVAIAFATRRLASEPVGFLLTRRPGPPSTLELALARRGVEQLDVGPLSLTAIRGLLAARLGLSLPRRLLHRIFEYTEGNPLFALELGRTVVEHGMPAIGVDIEVSDAIADLLGTRVARLPAPVRELLLAVALSADAHLIADRRTIDDAVELGVVHADGERVHAAHPMLASVARARAPLRERRAAHRALADAVSDESERALHLALATDGPDAELAAAVSAAAAGASARGARAEAVVLGEQALRLTFADDGDRGDRLLSLAEYLERAGERQRVTDLVTPALEWLPHGRGRARAWLLLSEGGTVDSYAERAQHYRHALAESGGDPDLTARVLAMQAANEVIVGVERIREASAPASEVDSALTLRVSGWARCLRGQPFDDVCERFRACSDGAVHLIDSPEPVTGLRHSWRGEMDAARATTTRFLALADERGEAVSYTWLRLNLCGIELRAGRWPVAEQLLDEWAESSDRALLSTPAYQYNRALLAAGRGRPDEAERWATPALADAEARGYRWHALEARRALGTAALLAHDPARAAATLLPVWEHTVREGIDEPGAFPVAGDLVEALAELGEHAEAVAITQRLVALSESQRHPWGRATAKRCGATVQFAAGETAASLLEAAAADFGQLGLPYDRARSLLALGRAQRRLRKWRAARDALEGAVAGFDALGSDGWADRARSELSRVGARRPRPAGELTPTEERVARLAAEGHANKEIARMLFVTVHTVEAHLSKAYAKLGVRSRTQLAGRLAKD
ncbi:LuxR C-terminal-related transcriptional regulator [Solirubrobacter taibaiensis]|nr:LuxR C-terminal-related transcriptional regulator [Solirubrobacter taibaiensis]